MTPEEAIDVIRTQHHAVLATTRGDGGVQMSPVGATVDGDGRVVVSSRETAVKVKNLRRRPHAAVCVIPDNFYGGRWVQAEGPVEIVSLPDAMEPLVSYYRSIAGEHPDWDDYRAAMQREQRCLIRIRVERAGPSQMG
ncbi:MAG TPA: PPOX class F420-dependent oxidoreductase [Candidatus Dormibacteraeota bacterium]|nr:PPOX class F420-dependent oxidoreductase [Candidatus Dormibacteraeota bacterium]